MKQKFLLIISLLTISIIATGFSMKCVEKPISDYDYLRTRLENTKIYTMDVLKAMPDSIYGFRPSENVRSYNALAYHIVYSIEWNLELMKGEPIEWISEGEDQMTKKELIRYGDEQFDKLLTFIKEAEDTTALTDKIIDVLNHNAHHRGQMVTYLRLKGISPPNYR